METAGFLQKSKATHEFESRAGRSSPGSAVGAVAETAIQLGLRRSLVLTLLYTPSNDPAEMLPRRGSMMPRQENYCFPARFEFQSIPRQVSVVFPAEKFYPR